MGKGGKHLKKMSVGKRKKRLISGEGVQMPPFDI